MKRLFFFLTLAFACSLTAPQANAQTEKVREHYLSYENQIPHGTVVYTWYFSKSLNCQRRLAVYLPPSYFSGKDYYPVLYLLHGTFGDEQNWVKRGCANIMDNLIAEGRAKEMIVIMPNTNMWQQACSEFTGIPDPYSDGKSATEHLTDGRFEESFSEIISFTEKNFRTITKKNSRAIAGLSRGGFFAMHISHYLNSLFDYVGLFSPTYATSGIDRQELTTANLFTTSRRTPKVYKNVEKDLKRQFQTPPALYWIAIGSDDFLYRENQLFLKKMDEWKYPYIYHESEGGHSWENWQDYLILFAPQLF